MSKVEIAYDMIGSVGLSFINIGIPTEPIIVINFTKILKEV